MDLVLFSMSPSSGGGSSIHVLSVTMQNSLSKNLIVKSHSPNLSGPFLVRGSLLATTQGLFLFIPTIQSHASVFRSIEHSKFPVGVNVSV